MTGVQTCALPICFPVTILTDGYEIAERIAQNPNKVQVTCIEPNHEQMAILKESYPQATTYQLAVSDKSAKKVPFTVYEGEIGMVVALVYSTIGKT